MYRISKTNPETEGGALIQDAVNRKLNEYKDKIFGWLIKQAQEAKLNEISPEESIQKEKAILLSSTYLVSKENKEDFTRVIKSLGEECKRKGLEFECTETELPYTSPYAK